MVWVVFTIIFGIAGSIGLAMIFFSAADSPSKFWGMATVGFAVLAEVILTAATSFALLGTGQVGLQYNFAGKLVGVKENAGVVPKAPWSHIKKESVQIQREEFLLDRDNSAVSKDQQPVFGHLVLNYQVDPKHVFTLYKEVGPNWKAKLVDSRVLQDFKEITATYPTIQLTAQREQLRQETKRRLVNELRPYSITVTDFFIQNLGFSEGYQNAIEAKQVQVQAAQQAQAKVAQIQAEADQAVAQAQGLAKSRVVAAEAEAKANKLIGNSINDRLIDLRRIEALAKANTIYVPENGSFLIGAGK